jgi:hypothetical protein
MGLNSKWGCFGMTTTDKLKAYSDRLAHLDEVIQQTKAYEAGLTEHHEPGQLLEQDLGLYLGKARVLLRREELLSIVKHTRRRARQLKAETLDKIKRLATTSQLPVN